MSQIVLAGIVALCAFLFYCGLRRIARIVLSRGASCGCGQDDCTCSAEGADKAECCCHEHGSEGSACCCERQPDEGSVTAEDKLPPCCRDKQK